MKIAIPTVNDALCDHFGHCQHFAVYEINNSQVVNKIMLPPPPHQPGVLPSWVAQQGVTDVIVGGIGQRAIDLFNQQGVNVYAGAESKKSDELVDNFLKGTLVTQANKCDH